MQEKYGKTECFKVEENTTGVRIDKILSQKYPEFSRSEIQEVINQGNISVNSKIVKKNYISKLGDIISLNIPEVKEIDIEPQNIALDIAYEDEDLIVVNKPKGMVVHPAPGNYTNTLVNALLYYCKDSLSGINGKLRPGIIHRLDKDTSGLLLVAKNDFSHRYLAAQLSAYKTKREYQAVVYGKLYGSDQIDAAIGRSTYDRKKMSVNAKYPKSAKTYYEVLENYNDFTLLKIHLETGRTHQIRVHMAYIKHPVAGDPVYGPKKCIKYLQGQCLHAKKIAFRHPRTDEYIEIDSNLPEYFLNFLDKLRN